MLSLFEYVERERSTFDEKPFGAVDAAVLSQAVMIDPPRVVPCPPSAPGPVARLASLLSPAAAGARFTDILDSVGAEPPAQMFTGLVPGDIGRLLPLLAISPRFRDLKIRDYRLVERTEPPVQFGAMTFTWRERVAFVAFRGTDAPFAGWRENFEMCYRDEVEAQGLARAYLDEVAAHLPRRIHVLGHSKGGNLALYAALTCSEGTRRRIASVWSLDAPGFREGRFDEGRTEALSGRVVRIVPADSVVGMLLECPYPARAVESSAVGIDQHSAFTWEIEGDDFAYLDRPSDFALGFHEVVGEWLAGMDDARKLAVVNALFAAIDASGAADMASLLTGGAEALRLVGEAVRGVDQESREVLNDAFGELAGIVARRVGEDAAASFSAWVRQERG